MGGQNFLDTFTASIALFPEAASASGNPATMRVAAATSSASRLAGSLALSTAEARAAYLCQAPEHR